MTNPLPPNMAMVFIDQFQDLAKQALKLLDQHRHADPEVMIMQARHRSLTQSLNELTGKE